MQAKEYHICYESASVYNPIVRCTLDCSFYAHVFCHFKNGPTCPQCQRNAGEQAFGSSIEVVFDPADVEMIVGVWKNNSMLHDKMEELNDEVSNLKDKMMELNDRIAELEEEKDQAVQELLR
jgi:uncharacterized protein (DUF342 family)